jgi:hypothetical protein
LAGGAEPLSRLGAAGATSEHVDGDIFGSFVCLTSTTKASGMVRLPEKRVIEVDGQQWEVSAVIEGVGWDAELPVRRASWLSFLKGDERRFITPLPADWAEWSDERLAAELANSRLSKRRMPPG